MGTPLKAGPDPTWPLWETMVPLVKPGHTRFGTGIDSNVCDRSCLKLRRVVFHIRLGMNILFGTMLWHPCEVDHGLPVRHAIVRP